ncbi:citrate synthase-lysine N-methyltransferase CSKMT, mitochondrial [Podarcis raffonei]|uniref:citrate synthase-lysine N-methyltransferase CSKMT, mitochondrial n=1 Tax=Podarcis raffonei TaxID=65483 RepID=UPI0023293927|nr:citrate synthase-lysine N-methyltransferase CSKMT, mitochondrial [Podarcis raffonei]
MAAAAATAASWLKGPRGVFRTLVRSSLSSASSSSSWSDDLLRQMDRRGAWDRFYSAKEKGASHPGHFDWFFSYEDVSGFLLSFLQSSPAGQTQILDVGCGTSALSLGLFRDSPRQLHISCLDFSPPAIDSLQQLVRESPPPGHPLSELHCYLADATALTSTFEEGSFHLILDKGTCDTLLRCPQGPGRAKTLVSECLRVLRPTGNLLQFSDEDPDARVPFLEQAGGVKVTVKEIAHIGGICYYAYILSPDSSGTSGAVK